MTDELPNETASASFSMRGCKINRAQLDRMLDLAGRDLENKKCILATIRKGRGITSSITGSTVDELIGNIRRSTSPGNPERIDNLTVHITRLPDNDKQIYIHINDPNSSLGRNVAVSVLGSNPEWVIGRTGRLNDFFAGTRSTRIPPINNIRYCTALIGIVVAVFFYFPVSRVLKVSGSLEAGSLVAIMLAVFIVGPAYLLGARIDRIARTQLQIPPPPARERRDPIDVSILIGTFIIVVLTIIGIRISHSDATHSPPVDPSPSPSSSSSVNGHLRGADPSVSPS